MCLASLGEMIWGDTFSTSFPPQVLLPITVTTLTFMGCLVPHSFQVPKSPKSLAVSVRGKHYYRVRSESGCLSHTMGKHFTSWGPPSQAERPSEGTSTGPTSTNSAVSRILGHAKEGLPPPPWGFLTADVPTLAALISYTKDPGILRHSGTLFRLNLFRSQGQIFSGETRIS